MATNRDKQRGTRSVVRPTGAPLGWTPGSIAELADVTDGDKLDAVEDWRRRAPRRYRELLDARPRRRSQRPNGSDDG